MSAQLLETAPANHSSSKAAARALPTAASASVPIQTLNTIVMAASLEIVVNADGSVPPLPTVNVPFGALAQIQLTISDPLNRYTFVNGVAFLPAPPPSVLPSPGLTSMTFNWQNKDVAFAGQSFNYVIFLLSTDGSVKMVDPTVENDPHP